MMKQRGAVPWWLRAQNTAIGWLVGSAGINLQGAEQLEVRGRKSGEPHRVPVNPVTVGGDRYLLSPRGETAWVKNIRASGEGALRRGGKVVAFAVEEVPDADKVPILRAYLQRWAWQVQSIMGAGKDADDATLRDIAPKHPVFRIVPAGALSPDA